MHLASVRVNNLGPYGDLSLDLGMPPRALTVVFGADGLGKTTLVSAIAGTRPGHALPPMPARRADASSFVVTDWLLGDDDPARPHVLRVASPNAKIETDENEALLRRREQAHFDRIAQERGGFVLVSFSGARWFSRTHVLLAQPDRRIVRWDTRSPASFDDATRADLARETKQVLSYASIATALSRGGAAVRFGALEHALKQACTNALEPFGLAWDGANADTLEPIFTRNGETLSFDDIPKGAKHLTAIVSLTMRALFSAYEADTSPREREGVVLVDDLELGQDGAMHGKLVPLLERAFPRVQWIVTTASPTIANGCTAEKLVTLRRPSPMQPVEIHEGALH
jgi:hypothetical protein